MRRFLVISGLVVALIAGGLMAAPRLVTWDDYRAVVIARAEALTGSAVAFDGPIDLALLPRPTVTLGDATLTRTGGADPAARLEVDRLDLELAAMPLLRGQVEVRAVRLVRPTFHLDDQDALPGGGPFGALGALLALPLDGPSRLSVVDGRARFAGGAGSSVAEINLELAAESPDGPFTLRGGFEVAAVPIALDARLGRIAGGESSTIQLEVTSQPPGSQAVSLRFRGLTRWRPDAPGLRGQVILESDELRSALIVLEGATGMAVPPALGLASPFRLGGRLELEGDALVLDELDLELAATGARGRLDVALEEPPTVDLTLDVPRLRLTGSALPPALTALPALLQTLPGPGRVALSVDALDYRGETVRRLRARLSAAPGAALVVDEARAFLPGQADASFSGEITAADDELRLDGDLQVTTDDLGRGLAWLGVAATGVGPGRLRTLSLASEVQVEPGGLRLRALDLRLDASRITGSFAARWQGRRQIAAALELDRLDLDAYLPDLAPADLPAWLDGALAETDLALEARIGRLVWQGWRWQTVGLSGRSVGPKITLDQLAIAEVAGTRVDLAGSLDLASHSFAITTRLAAERPTTLARRLGFEPATLLARLAPLSIEGEAKGQIEAFDLNLSARHEDIRLAVLGTAGWVAGGPNYDLRLDGHHPDHRALLRGLGVGHASLDADPAMPVELAATLRTEASGDTAVAGSARLGPSSVTGRVAWQSSGPRPKVSANLSAGEPRADLLGAVLGLAGLRLDPALADGVQGGAWPATPIALGWLGRFDGALELTAKGGLAGAGLELSADWAEGRLAVRRFATDLLGGELRLEVSLDAGRPLPFMALALDLSAIDPTRLAAWLDLPPIVEGRADLYLEATTAGLSPRDMVRGTIGDLRIDLAGGRLIGLDDSLWRSPVAAGGAPAGLDSEPLDIDARRANEPGPGEPGPARPAVARPAAAPSVPIERLSGMVAIKRGIATASDVEMDLAGAKGRLEGRLDLLYWAGDLRLELIDPAGDPLTIHLVGPLDRPQIRAGRRIDEMAPLP